MISMLALFLIGNNYFAGPGLPLPLAIDPISSAFKITSPEPRVTAEMELSAKSVLILERDSGMVLYEKNARTPLPIASLTKLMTALLILEQSTLSDIAVIPAEATQIEGRKAYLAAGEKMSVSNLLNALLIHSGNDAAVALALHESRTVSEFVIAMNRRAHLLGLKGTEYANPHGLDDERNYSTAFDISLLANKLLAHEFVQDTVQKRAVTITDTSGNLSHQLQTTNELLFTDFPVFGLKTGTTDLAGECFVGLVKLGRKEFLITILGSKDRFKDTKALIWALQNR